MKRWFITVLTLTLLLTALCGVYAQAAEEAPTLTWQQGTYYDNAINASLVSRKYAVIPLTEGDVIRFVFPTGNWGIYGYYADANGSYGYNTYTADRAVFTFEATAINGRVPTELRLTAFHRSGNNVTITDELWETFDVEIYKSAATTQPTEATTVPSVTPGVDTQLIVATQNYGLWRNGVTEYAPDDKAESVAAAWRQMLRDNNADILGGQEYMQHFNESKTMDPKECVFGEMYPYQFTTGEKYTGKNIVSKTKLYDETVVNFKAGSGRQYIKAYTYIDGKKICIINAHLSFEEDINVARKAQIEELISVADKEQYAIILGDFNVYTVDEFKLFEEAGYNLANGGKFGNFNTWPNFGSTAAGNRYLDNIIVSSSIEILEVSCDRRDLSDHAMLVAKLNLKGGEGEETAPTEETHVPEEKCPHCGEDVVWEDWSGGHLITDAADRKHYRLTGSIAPSGQIQIGKTDGNIKVDVVIDTNGYNIKNASRAFAVYSGSTLSLVNMDSRVSLITGGYTNSPGGVINLNPNTNTGGCTLNLYGGIRIASTAESSYTYGGTIALETGVLNMYGGIVEGRETKNDGGAVYIKKADFNLYDGTIIGGTAGGGEGGAVAVDTGNFLMSGGRIEGGKATNGGAVYVTNSTFTMSGGRISGGQAVYGGAVYINMSDTDISGGTIENGKASASDGSTPRGGNIYMYQSSKKAISISGGVITGGKAQNGNGGNLYADNAAIIHLSGDVIFSGGEATRAVATNNGGGNIYMTNGTKLVMSGGTIENGTATSYGGNIYSRANIDMTGGTIKNGVAANGGNLMVTGHNSTKTFNFSGGVIENGTATIGTIDGKAAKGTYNGDNVYLNSALMNVSGGMITDDNGGNAILAFALDDARPATVTLTLAGKTDLAEALSGKIYAISGATISSDLGETESDADGDLIWKYTAPVIETMPGDMNGDDKLTNDDVVALMWNILFPEQYPLDVETDLNKDGTLSNADVVALMWYVLFPEQYPL